MKELDERVLGLTVLDLRQLKQWAEEIQGEWNGKEPGREEDRFHCAYEISKKCVELEELLDEIQNI